MKSENQINSVSSTSPLNRQKNLLLKAFNEHREVRDKIIKIVCPQRAAMAKEDDAEKFREFTHCQNIKELESIEKKYLSRIDKLNKDLITVIEHENNPEMIDEKRKKAFELNEKFRENKLAEINEQLLAINSQADLHKSIIENMHILEINICIETQERMLSSQSQNLSNGISALLKDLF